MKSTDDIAGCIVDNRANVWALSDAKIILLTADTNESQQREQSSAADHDDDSKPQLQVEDPGLSLTLCVIG